jgi:hypothetical protein
MEIRAALGVLLRITVSSEREIVMEKRGEM